MRGGRDGDPQSPKHRHDANEIMKTLGDVRDKEMTRTPPLNLGPGIGSARTGLNVWAAIAHAQTNTQGRSAGLMNLCADAAFMSGPSTLGMSCAECLNMATKMTCKGMFSAYTQALRDRDLPEEDIRVLNKIIPDFLFDLRGAGEAFEDMKQMGLSGVTPLGEANTKAPNSDYHNHKDAPPVAAWQAEVARDYLKRAARIDELSRLRRAYCHRAQ